MPVEPEKTKRLLSPLDRAAELLFGAILAITFTCSMSVGSSHQVEMTELLVGVIGCNLAWGFVDGIMYVIETLARRNRNRVLFHELRISPNSEDARKILSDALPPIIATNVTQAELEAIRKK